VTQQFASIHKFATLHYCSRVHLEHGSSNLCK